MEQPKKGVKPYHLQHIRIEDYRSEKPYSRPMQDMSGISSKRNRDIHGPKLESELTNALADALSMQTLLDPQLAPNKQGIYLEVVGGETSTISDLNWTSKNIRLGALHLNEAGEQIGALYVPNTSASFLKNKVSEYARENTPKGTPKHESKFDSVEAIRAGTIKTLWTDTRPFPTDANEKLWWEFWCFNDSVNHLIHTAERLNLRISENRLYFPDLEVVPIHGNSQEISRLLQNTDAIEELRRASDSPTFFTTTLRHKQEVWVEDLLSRINPPPLECPAVCILDTGVARAHPLLNMALNVDDCQSVDNAWGSDDDHPHGHGTSMAGTVLYSDLTYALADQREISLDIRLESVKLLPPFGFKSNDPQSYGVITQSAVSIAEHNNPHRPRVFCMAVTNDDMSGERPTSWSAALDQICSGSMKGDIPEAGEEQPRRLFIISAGNVPDASNPDDVSDLDEFPIEDPAQAWNVITVGGFTDKTDLMPEDKLDDWTAMAGTGEHSPYSRISTDWDHSRTPMKPEVVFEAGNRALSPARSEILSGVSSLSILTTNKDFTSDPLATFWATSSATAQAAGLAASIMAKHPSLWPETVRALMIHSAQWTPAMQSRIHDVKSKKERIGLARQFGYGVPRLDRALASAQNDLALLAESYIQPFKREKNDAGKIPAEPSFNEVHYYDLPWPRQALELLENKLVQLKITLSYFIEPSPGEMAPVIPARYQSFGLRFALKRHSDTEEVFKQRINKQEERTGPLPKAETDDRWTFGTNSIAAGSLHCDVWVGRAIDLASRDKIAIYPVGGWWRYRAHLKRFNSLTRYSLIVSITSDEQETELYTEIANLIGINVETEISN